MRKKNKRSHGYTIPDKFSKQKTSLQMSNEAHSSKAPSLADCSQLSGCNIAEEVIQLKPHDCNKASSYPGTVSGVEYSQFFQGSKQKPSVQMGCKDILLWLIYSLILSNMVLPGNVVMM